MFMGFFKPLLEEAELIDPNNASDPMAGTVGMADNYALAEFAAYGVEAVGGMGDGINMANAMPSPQPAMDLGLNQPAPNQGMQMQMATEFKPSTPFS